MVPTLIIYFRKILRSSSILRCLWISFARSDSCMQSARLYTLHHSLPKGIELLFNKVVIWRSFIIVLLHTRTCLGMVLSKDRWLVSLGRSRYVIADACGFFFQRSEAKDHNVKSIDNHLLNTFWDPSTVLKNILFYFISMNWVQDTMNKFCIHFRSSSYYVLPFDRRRWNILLKFHS